MAELGDRRLIAFEAMPDEQVVKHAKRGSRSATQHLLSKYRSLVEGKAKSYFLIGAEHDDVVQEGMIGLFKAIRDFSEENLSAFKSFAELCITRQIITAIKTATRQKHSPLNYSISMDMPIDDADGDCTVRDTVTVPAPDDPHRAARGKQFYTEIQRYIRRDLSRLEADALLLYMNGRSYQQIAKELSCGVKQVDNALQRAKKKMGRALNDTRAEAGAQPDTDSEPT
ncbi:MAG TPA: RNA polymerase sporulation sigma factor SigH [Armatimonadetes bacterium]|jgi:RNA polymerase sporulation-specific sigma factor|nr:RNA polymerase sporulation sigma factor SigH [Armatimonadota bacterium]